MKGYKGTDKKMQCRGMQFELGKTYKHNGVVELCKSGFHFCERLNDVFNFYSNEKGNRFFEIEAEGKIIKSENKNVASAIKVVRELSTVEVNRAYYDSYGFGYGNGHGFGNGYGYGYGYGNGFGNGYGYGYGDGYGDGFGYGYSYGYGHSYGDGNGDGFGNGYGNGNIQKILNYK